MSDKLIKAKLSGKLTIGKWVSTVYHLDDDRRVITQRDFMEIFDIRGKGYVKGHRIAGLVDHPSLKIRGINNLLRDIRTPIKFINLRNLPTYGYEGDVIIDFCKAILKAREYKLLKSNKELRYAQAAESLVISVAIVGIISLIDEATGFQKIRDKKALQAILDKYLRKEFATWAKRFPDEFYEEIFRLKGWLWRGMKINRPSVIGRYTTDIVYQRLAPGITEELEKRNPKNASGNRLVRHHQLLTDDIGHPALSHHIHAVILFMKASSNWRTFYNLLQKALPIKGEAYQFELFEDDE